MNMHTEGPWEACEHGDYGDNDGQCRVVSGDDIRIAVVLGLDTPENEANANLIAAAPELLEAVEILVSVREMFANAALNAKTYGPAMKLKAELWDKADAAIKKAKGLNE